MNWILGGDAIILARCELTLVCFPNDRIRLIELDPSIEMLFFNADVRVKRCIESAE